MAITFPWQEILNEPGGEAVRQGGDAIRRVFCELRRDRPYLFNTANLAAAATTLQPALVSRDLWDRVCRDVPLSEPQTAVVGGQCPVQYDVRCFITNPENGAAVGSTFNALVQGPLQSCTAEEFPGTIAGRSSYRTTVVDALGNALVNLVGANSPVRNARRTWQITRSDSLPDNCGNRDPLPSVQPPDPPTLPPTVTIRQGDYPDVEVNVEWPTYDTTNWPDFTFEPDIVIPPYRYRALPWGLDVDFEPRASFVPPVPVVLDPVVIGTIGEILANVAITAPIIELILELTQGQDVDLTEIERLIRCCSCGENDVTSIETLFSSSQGGIFPLPDGSVMVELEILEPVSSRTPIQDGSGSSPDVLYWGWYSFGGSLDSSGERVPLAFEKTSVLLPDGAKSFLFSASYGNRANGSVTKIIRDCS